MKPLIDIVELGRSIEYDFPPLARLAKLTEEVGEFSETTMHTLGYLPHKDVKETPFGEAADAIICIVDVLASCYPELGSEWIIESLLKHIENKSLKWKSIIDKRNSE